MDLVGTADPYFRAKIDDGQVEFMYVKIISNSFAMKKNFNFFLVQLVLLIH
jgi:hypothetical protein